jgi:hypothetical protein
VSVVGNGYHISGSDQSTARAVAGTLAARHPDVEPEEILAVEVLPVEVLPLEEEGEPLAWLVSLLVEFNASEALEDRDPASGRV